MKRLPFAFLLLALSACASNPFNTAQTVEQKAAALYGQFVIAEQAARDVVCPNHAERRADPTVNCKPTAPAGVVRAIATVDAIAKPLADTLAVAGRQYSTAKAEVEAAAKAGGQPTGQALAAVTVGLQNLTRAYEEAAPSIRALIAAIKSHTEKN